MAVNYKFGPPSKPLAVAATAAQLQARFREGLALHNQGQLAQAQQIYLEVLALQPGHFDALHMLGVLAGQTNNPAQSVAFINRAIEVNPRVASAYSNRGNALSALTQYQAAIASYDQAIALMPGHVNAHINRGKALYELQQYQAAIASYDSAIAINPGHAEAYCHRGDALHELKQHASAIASYDAAIAIQPAFAQAHCNRGIALNELNQHVAAVASFDRAIAIRADYAEAYCNRGVALDSLKQHQAAVASHDKALAIRPDFAEACYNRGVALSQLQQFQEAIASYDRAIAIQPHFAQAHMNRGNALNELKLYRAAIESYDRALAIKPDFEFLRGVRLHLKMRICDWHDQQCEVSELSHEIQDSKKVTTPFSFLALSSSLPLQRKAAQIWIEQNYPASKELGSISRRTRREKIRLGYFSMDFRNHPVAVLTAGLLEVHDRSRFEVVAFSYGPDTGDEMRVRVAAACDRFIDVRGQSGKEIAELARQLEIDIAIDLTGLTSDALTGIFAVRAAPVQISYLGYPGTMGAGYIDYLIADKQLIPEEALAHYAEKIVYLPSFQANDRKRAISAKVFTREELGLPPSGFVFCCFNNTYKITPGTFDGWMRLLKQVEGSVLLLCTDSDLAVTNLKWEASQRSVDANRLVFGKKLPAPDYLARYRVADLFLDTLPYNAGTTASDALWAGLPVLTCTGEAYASRMAASVLVAIDLPELITVTQEEYEALAISLAKNPERLQAIREKLEHNRYSTPLFDISHFAMHIEDAYTQIVERFHAGLPPEHVFVAR